MNDPRLTLVHGGLARAELEGMIEADAFAETRPMRCAVSVAPIRKTADAMTGLEDQLVFGEAFDVLLEDGAFSLGQARRDGYVGWVETAALVEGVILPTHWVRTLSTIAFAKPDFKSAPLLTLPMNALVQVVERAARFARVEGAGWVFEGHLAGIASCESDPVAVAEKFVGAPYLWGGRTAAGIDCSGLVQQAHYACAIGTARDSDMQAKLGRSTTRSELGPGMLVCWPGHIGMVTHRHTLVHANAHFMMTNDESLDAVVARKDAAGEGAPISFRQV